jgi:hypothetical protein
MIVYKSGILVVLAPTLWGEVSFLVWAVEYVLLQLGSFGILLKERHHVCSG